jgi:ribosome biogenesis GTPase / thiamine phosphate phosphatase
LSLPTFQLASLGWDSRFAEKFMEIAPPGAVAARVLADYGASYLVHDGAIVQRAMARHVDPTVGDWVVLDGGEIRGIVERRTVFSRRAAGNENRQQILAANVDVAFVVAAATDVNARRIERYLTLAWQSGAVPVVLLTKADVAPSAGAMRDELEAVCAGTPVIVTSSVTGEGVEAIEAELQPARTGVLLGPSGVGKSTLINTILGSELLRTREIHGGSGEGRHMTSHRQLVQLPEGGMIIDTPGLREAQLWQGEEGLDYLFQDIEELALGCRFSDCAHDTEPGCAIKSALADGRLDAGRLHSYRKLLRELRSIEVRSSARLQIEERKKWKRLTTAARGRARP